MSYRQERFENMDERFFGVMFVTCVIVFLIILCIPKKLYETNEKLANFIVNQLLITVPATVFILYLIYSIFIE